MSRPVRLLVLLLVCMGLSSACSSDGGSTDPGSVAGTYTLREVGGAPLPYTLFSGPRQITSGTLVLNSNGTFRQTYGLGFQGTATQTYSFTGGYTMNGSTISMSLDQVDDDGFALRSAQISGRTITGQGGRTTKWNYTFRK